MTSRAERATMEQAHALMERVLELLPADGKSLLVDTLVDTATEQGIKARQTWSALATLCSERRAITEWRGGYQFARRLAAATSDFPLRARPRRPTPRRSRTEARR